MKKALRTLIGIAVLITDITAITASNRIENQNKLLREIAFHNLIGFVALANILGLINIFNQNDMSDPFNKTIWRKC